MKPKTATCRKAVWLCQECGEDHNWESKPNRTMCHCRADAFLSDDGESYNCAGCGQFVENCKCGKPEKPKTPLQQEAEASIRLDRNQTWSEEDKPEKPKYRKYITHMIHESKPEKQKGR